MREIRRVWKVTDPAEANALAILRLMSGFASEEHYGMELLRILDTLLSGVRIRLLFWLAAFSPSPLKSNYHAIFTFYCQLLL